VSKENFEMRCDETLSLHNWIFNFPYVIKRHPVVS